MTVVLLALGALGFLLFCYSSKPPTRKLLFARGQRSSYLVLLLPGLLIGAAAFDLSSSERQVIQFRLRGYEIPFPPVTRLQTPEILIVGGPSPSSSSDQTAPPLPYLRTPYVPSDPQDRGVVLRLGTEPHPVSTELGAPQKPPFALAAECKPGMEFVAFIQGKTEQRKNPWEENPGQFCNVIELRNGDTISLYGGPSLSFRYLDAGGWQLGPCSFPQGDKNYAMLDFYYHDAECKPIPTELGSEKFSVERWITVQKGGEGAGAYAVPVKSFLTVQNGLVYLVRLDNVERLTFTPSKNLETPSPAFTPQPQALWLVRRTFRLTEDRLYERKTCRFPNQGLRRIFGRSKDTCLCNYSSSVFCRRIKPVTTISRIDLSFTDQSLRLGITSPSIVGFRYQALQAQSGDKKNLLAERRDAENKSSVSKIAYSVGIPSDPGIQNLIFPFHLDGGDLIRTVFHLRQPCAKESTEASSCIQVSTSTRSETWHSGSVIPLPPGDSSQTNKEGNPQRHLLQVIDFGHLWWLAALCLSLLALQAFFLWPMLVTFPARAGLLFLNACLSLRLLLGYKVFALYPYAQEGMESGLLGLAVVPIVYVTALYCWVPKTVDFSAKFTLLVTIVSLILLGFVFWQSGGVFPVGWASWWQWQPLRWTLFLAILILVFRLFRSFQVQWQGKKCVLPVSLVDFRLVCLFALRCG